VEKFADEAIIEVSSGKGGNGCAAFRREKYGPRGGPAGGDGGRGGDVIFTLRRNLRTLAHLRHKQTFKAENGHDGEGRGRYGRNGGDVIVPLPPGSILRDAGTGELLRDFGRDPGDFLFLRGGKGGWGNIHFKSPANQAPRKALEGRRGETRLLRVELRIIADIGLVGFPNAGKSSLLGRLTNARPRIAPYPFTTKIPNLGVLSWGSQEDDRREIVIADIPGIIEGASEGLGLGIRFLRHISRSAALAFLIDLGDDSYSGAFEVLLRELEHFAPELARKRRIILGTKTDLEGTAERLEELKARCPGERVEGISVFSGMGIEKLGGLFVELAAGEAGAPEVPADIYPAGEEDAEGWEEESAGPGEGV
jgi:GTP-binding protein